MVDKAVYRYIEHELYNYDETLIQLEELRYEIIHSTPIRQPGNARRPSDPTAQKAVKLVSNRVLARMERTIRAVDRALMLLTEDHRCLFELKYRQGKHMRQICEELAISDSSYFRRKREIIETVARELGLINVA